MARIEFTTVIALEGNFEKLRSASPRDEIERISSFVRRVGTRQRRPANITLM